MAFTVERSVLGRFAARNDFGRPPVPSWLSFIIRFSPSCMVEIKEGMPSAHAKRIFASRCDRAQNSGTLGHRQYLCAPIPPSIIQGSQRRETVISLISNLYPIAQGDLCFCLLAEIIDAFARGYHLGFEGHPFVIIVADAVKQTTDIARTTSFGAHRESSIQKSVVSEKAQESYGIKDVGFAQ